MLSVLQRVLRPREGGWMSGDEGYDPLARKIAKIEQEEAEIRHIAWRAVIFLDEIIRQRAPTRHVFTMLYSWFTMERDRVREERAEEEY